MPRPRNVGVMDLLQYRFPITAIVSILHRISGVLLLIYLPFVLYYLHLSLSGASAFLGVKCVLTETWGAFFLWIFLSAAFFHVIAGVKHLVMDCGLGESLRAAKVSSLIVLLLGILSTMGIGVWLW